jgi:hypothetical protein
MEVSMNGDNPNLKWMMTEGTTIYGNHHLTKNIKLHNQTMGNINKHHGAVMLSAIIATGFVVMITIVYLSIYPSIHLSICPSVHPIDPIDPIYLI